MINLEIKENEGLMAGWNNFLLGLWNSRDPDLDRIVAEAKKTGKVVVEHRTLFPSIDYYDTRTHVILHINTGSYKYKGHRTFGVKGDGSAEALESMAQANTYLKNLQESLRSQN